MPRKAAAQVAEYNDAITSVLDKALSRAESQLQKLLDPLRTGFEAMTPADIADAFAYHVATHLRDELTGATRYKNNVAAFRQAVKSGRDTAF